MCHYDADDSRYYAWVPVIWLKPRYFNRSLEPLIPYRPCTNGVRSTYTDIAY